ncbi:TFIIB-type zinc ribbon-containing protein [Plantactinospora solaniradicis]|uniref:TFIIB-type zinc ribbon-containing protein n=1 Tax=Plantactinospora solaniradicis TaxID=1723736 RepID=A0ABW1K5M1_9ACTN
MAGDYGVGPAPATCPDCGGPVRPDRERLCPRCGYPLMFLRHDPEPEARVVARAPGERDDATAIFPPPGTPARQTPGTVRRPARPGEVACPSCGYGNPHSRVRCQRCGRELRVVHPVVVMPPPLPPAPPPFRAPPRYGLIALVSTLLIALLVLLALMLIRSDVFQKSAAGQPTATITGSVGFEPAGNWRAGVNPGRA